MTGLFRQSVFGRLGGYEEVNDADRLGRDPAMHWIVGGPAVAKAAASTSQMGRFETVLLATDRNLAALADLSGRWIDRVHEWRPSKTIEPEESTVAPDHIQPAESSGRIQLDGMRIRKHNGGSIDAADRE